MKFVIIQNGEYNQHIAHYCEIFNRYIIPWKANAHQKEPLFITISATGIYHREIDIGGIISEYNIMIVAKRYPPRLIVLGDEDDR